MKFHDSMRGNQRKFGFANVYTIKSSTVFLLEYSNVFIFHQLSWKVVLSTKDQLTNRMHIWTVD